MRHLSLYDSYLPIHLLQLWSITFFPIKLSNIIFISLLFQRYKQRRIILLQRKRVLPNLLINATALPHKMIEHSQGLRLNVFLDPDHVFFQFILEFCLLFDVIFVFCENRSISLVNFVYFCIETLLVSFCGENFIIPPQHLILLHICFFELVVVLGENGNRIM